MATCDDHEKMSTVNLHLRKSTAASVFVLMTVVAAPVWAENAKAKADEVAGAVLFRDQGCAHCHGVGGAGGKKGPDLTGLPKDKEWTPEKMTKQILNGGQKMPPFSDALTDAQISQLVSYLKAKHRPEPPAAQASDATGTN